MPTFAIPKKGRVLGDGYSRAEKLTPHPGRRTAAKGYQSAVSWISDLIALRKVIILCSFCRHKFNPRRFGYRRIYVPDLTGKTDGYTVNGSCDACKQFTPNLGGGTAYQPEELWSKTNIDPAEAKRARRAALGDTSIWDRIRKEAHNFPKVDRR